MVMLCMMTQPLGKTFVTFFRNKWCVGDSSREDPLRKWLGRVAGKFVVEDQTVRHAVVRFKKTAKVDYMGVSYALFDRLLAFSDSWAALVELAEDTLNSSNLMGQIEIHGVVKAKLPGAVPASKTRTLLLQCALLTFMQIIVAVKLEQAANNLVPRSPGIYLKAALCRRPTHGGDGRSQWLWFLKANVIVPAGLDS